MDSPTPRSSELIEDPKDKRCAPHLDFSAGSCISLESLIMMAKEYNKKYPKATQIILDSNLENDFSKRHKYKKKLIKQFNNIMKKKCSRQTCWLKQDFISRLQKNMKEELLKFTFRPEGPEAQFEWLNTFNIDNVMDQYEKKYPGFLFLGAVPMDFDDIKNYHIKDFNFEEAVKDGITKLGIVFNLDESWQPGSHWVAAYFDLKTGENYYFDSYGTKEDKRVNALRMRVADYCKKNNITPKMAYNKTRHQRGNSECGMYSIYFILNMLQGVDFDKFNKDPIPDMVVNKFRDTVFNNTDIVKKYEKNLNKNKSK